jgi:hypothetical protein
LHDVDARIAFLRLSSAHGCLNGAPPVIFLHPGFARLNAFFLVAGRAFREDLRGRCAGKAARSRRLTLALARRLHLPETRRRAQRDGR